MRVAVISDIHGNLPALEAALAAIEDSAPQELWCLGDMVGYGAHPDECASLVSERCGLALAGNHDLAVLDEIEVGAFSPAAAEAVRWTQRNADAGTLEFLRGLEPADESREVGLYHASPRDPVWEYVLWMDQAEECLAVQSGRVSLIGHSHVALYFVDPAKNHDGDQPVASQSGAAAPDARRHETEVRGAHAEPGTRIAIGEGRWLINPGSVGQPRDGDPRAAWMELDTEAWTATYRRTEYDIDRAANAIDEAGLPHHLATRLYAGQ